MVKIFHFSNEWKVVSVAPKGGEGVHPPSMNLEVFLSDILATATKVEMYNHLDAF